MFIEWLKSSVSASLYPSFSLSLFIILKSPPTSHNSWITVDISPIDSHNVNLSLWLIFAYISVTNTDIPIFLFSNFNVNCYSLSLTAPYSTGESINVCIFPDIFAAASIIFFVIINILTFLKWFHELYKIKLMSFMQCNQSCECFLSIR